MKKSLEFIRIEAEIKFTIDKYTLDRNVSRKKHKFMG